jgi:hypothetical protein
MSRRDFYDEPQFDDRDDEFADERANARKRAAFEFLAAQEYRDSGTVLEWQDAPDTDDDEDLDA